MLQENLEAPWLAAFEAVLSRRSLRPGAPELPARLVPGEGLEPLVKDHVKRLRGAGSMQVTSRAGTDLLIALEGATCGGNRGYTTDGDGVDAELMRSCISPRCDRTVALNGQVVVDAGRVA